MLIFNFAAFDEICQGGVEQEKSDQEQENTLRSGPFDLPGAKGCKSGSRQEIEQCTAQVVALHAFRIGNILFKHLIDQPHLLFMAVLASQAIIHQRSAVRAQSALTVLAGADGRGGGMVITVHGDII